MALGAKGGTLPFASLVFCYAIEALAHAGAITEAADYAKRYGACMGSNQRSRISYLRAMAALEQMQGEPGLAGDHLLEARRLAMELELPGEVRQVQAYLDELEGMG